MFHSDKSQNQGGIFHKADKQVNRIMQKPVKNVRRPEQHKKSPEFQRLKFGGFLYKALHIACLSVC